MCLRGDRLKSAQSYSILPLHRLYLLNNGNILHVSYNPQNPNGQATSANSSPVVIASDQSAVPITGAINVWPGSAGGWSVNSQTALSNAKVAIKASAGTLGGYMFYNPNAAVTYMQVFDATSGSVTVGTTTPTYVIPLPPASGANIEFTLGIGHTTAITVAATTTATGSSAPGTALTGFFLYK